VLTTIILALITLAVVGVGLQPLFLTLRFRRYCREEEARSRPHFAPPVTVILPCKGVDPGFRENVEALLRQDYPDYEIVFVTATADDPAVPDIEAAIAAHPERRTRLVTAGIREGRSQKINNQLVALESVRPESEALVFVDSDARPQPDFLRRLIAPLQDETVGATTGFRWYVPLEGGFGSYLRAAWNGGGLPMLAHPRFAYAWGGAMAIRKRTLDEIGIRGCWDHALTDDFPLTHAVRAAGMGVCFVPQCLLGTHEDVSLRNAVEWTNRQTVICRVYNPVLWHGIFWTHAVLAAGMALGIGLLAGAALGRGGPWWLGLALLTVVPLEIINGLLVLGTVRRLLPPGYLRWKDNVLLAAAIPAAMGLILGNSIRSLLSHEIVWRGIRYVVISPTETRVLQGHG